MRAKRDGEAGPAGGASVDELLDRAVAAINRGDRATATALAGQVLAADSANAEAEDLLAAPSDPGEIRRLTIFFADLVDSTALSTRVEPETYRLLVGRYRELVLRAVNRYEGQQRLARTRAGPGPTAINRPADQVAISGAGKAGLRVVAGASTPKASSGEMRLAGAFGRYSQSRNTFGHSARLTITRRLRSIPNQH